MKQFGPWMAGLCVGVALVSLYAHYLMLAVPCAMLGFIGTALTITMEDQT